MCTYHLNQLRIAWKNGYGFVSRVDPEDMSDAFFEACVRDNTLDELAIDTIDEDTVLQIAEDRHSDLRIWNDSSEDGQKIDGGDWAFAIGRAYAELERRAAD